MEHPSGMAFEPGAHLGMFVRGVVVGNGVDQLACGHGALDSVEEADELLMAMLGHATAEHRAIANIEGGGQGCHTVALIIVGHCAAFARLERQPGWVRSSAWNGLFSSIDSTTVCIGGSM